MGGILQEQPNPSWDGIEQCSVSLPHPLSQPEHPQQHPLPLPREEAGQVVCIVGRGGGTSLLPFLYYTGYIQ